MREREPYHTIIDSGVIAPGRHCATTLLFHHIVQFLAIEEHGEEVNLSLILRLLLLEIHQYGKLWPPELPLYAEDAISIHAAEK